MHVFDNWGVSRRRKTGWIAENGNVCGLLEREGMIFGRLLNWRMLEPIA